MNYQKVYDDLIHRAKSENRKKLKTDNPDYVYYEAHHIIPYYLGSEGSCLEWKTHPNIVLLTARRTLFSSLVISKDLS